MRHFQTRHKSQKITKTNAAEVDEESDDYGIEEDMDEREKTSRKSNSVG